jgi:hypothetical protein
MAQASLIAANGSGDVPRTCHAEVGTRVQVSINPQDKPSPGFGTVSRGSLLSNELAHAR